MSKLSSGVLLIVAERVKPGVCVYTWRGGWQRIERGWTDVAGEKKVRKRNGEEIAYVSGETGRETGVGKRILFPSDMCVCVCVRVHVYMATRGPGINVDETELVHAHRLRRSHLMKYTSQLCRS